MTREPPQDVDAERSVLGALLLGPGVGVDAIGIVAELGVRPGDYVTPRHQHIAAAITTVAERADPVDTITVADELRRVGMLDEVGGIDALHQLQNATPTVSNVDKYARIVLKHARRRRLIHLASDLSRAAYDGDDDQVARTITDLHARPDDQSDELRSTWRAVNLADAIEGRDIDPAAVLVRTDGVALLYAGRVHWFQGEAESLKSWAAQAAAAEVLAADGTVLYIDYEDDDRGIVARMRSLGVGPAVLDDQTLFRYVRPDEPLYDSKGNAQRHMAELTAHLEHRWTLCVIDGVTEAMTTEALSILDNTDIAIWQRRLPKRIAATGAAVVCVDHLAKNAGAGRFAIGGQHKLAGVTGATYRFTISRRLRRALNAPTTGRVTITVEKDRPGWVRARAEGDDDTIAVLEVTAYPDGGATVALLVPADAITAPDWAVLVEIIHYVTAYDGATQRKIEDNVSGRAEVVRAAVRWLVQQHWLEVSHAGRSHYHSVTDLGRERTKDSP